MYKAVIFDLDGVICSTDEYHYLAWKNLADRLGVKFDREKNNRLRGVSRMESPEIVLEEYQGNLTETEKAELAESKNGLYREYLKEMTPKNLSVDVRDTLNALRERGYKLAIGSSSKNTSFILERIGLASFFDAVTDGTMIERSKPDPEVFLKAAASLGFEPESCVVVEDAAAGAEAASRGSFVCAGIGEASTYPTVAYKLKKVSDLLRCLG